MSLRSDVICKSAKLYIIPVRTRVPLKFGAEVLESVLVARVRVSVETADGTVAHGWGETPLSAQWAWPSARPVAERQELMVKFCRKLAGAIPAFSYSGHPIEIAFEFQRSEFHELWMGFRKVDAPDFPLLAALVCYSAFDIAIHDAYGIANRAPIYALYGPDHLNRDLADFFADSDAAGRFKGLYPKDFLRSERTNRLVAWHLVGGKDCITSEQRCETPEDGYPGVLTEWIERDGIKALKIKLTGTDQAADLDRLLSVDAVGQPLGVLWLTADFNCTVTDPSYVVEILDKLLRDHPLTYQRLLYVEQPFPYEIDEYPIDVHAVSSRKPLFMDESAHDWRFVEKGFALGWNGVALKTCKTQSGALLSMCWAAAHGMSLMVQDLTNPMLAQIPHVSLAAHTPTLMGVETNAMQFYPEASAAEALVHPGLYRRRKGRVDLSTVSGAGFGYRLSEITRELPEAIAASGNE